LIQSRGALATPPDPQLPYAAPAWNPAKRWDPQLMRNGLPIPGDPDNLALTDTNTRFFLSHVELVGGLSFELSTLGGRETAKVCGLNEALTANPLCALTRPPRAVFDRQLDRVFSWARQRADRMPEILTQVSPQWAFWGSVCNLHPERTPRTIELLLCGLQFSMLVTQKFKQMLACPRPVEYSPHVQPMLLTPAYATYPAGHTVEAYFFSRVMRALLGQVAGSQVQLQLDALALRISEHRVIAGLHFPVDLAAGYALAVPLAQYFVGVCTGAGDIVPNDIDGHAFPHDGEFEPWRPQVPGVMPGAPWSAKKSPLMQWMWSRAREEWRYHGFDTPDAS
jgi:hypothetical protein